MRIRFVAVLLFVLLQAAAAGAAGLGRGDLVAVVGDSITEQKLYSRYIEAYLTVCEPQLELRVCQFGWGGETAPEFAARMGNDLLPFHPTVMTTCYGMNDGQYSPMYPGKANRYREWQQEIVKRAKK